MIRSTVFASTAGTALVASAGSVYAPSDVDVPAATAAVAAPVTSDPSGADRHPQQHWSAAAGLGVATGTVAMAMHYP